MSFRWRNRSQKTEERTIGVCKCLDTRSSPHAHGRWSLFTFLNTLRALYLSYASPLNRREKRAEELGSSDILKPWNPIQHDPGPAAGCTMHSLNTQGDCHCVKRSSFPTSNWSRFQERIHSAPPISPTSELSNSRTTKMAVLYSILDFFLFLFLFFFLLKHLHLFVCRPKKGQEKYYFFYFMHGLFTFCASYNLYWQISSYPIKY